MINAKSLIHFIFVSLMLTIPPSCKSPSQMQQDEINSEEDAVNIPALWNWFSRYIDNIAQFIGNFEKSSANIKNTAKIVNLFPSESLPQVTRILGQNLKQVPQLAAKLASLENGRHKLDAFPLTGLPSGIPQKYQRAFQVLQNSVAGSGSGKIAARRFTAQLIQKFAEKNKISFSEAYEKHLVVFTRAEFGVNPEPLPNGFVDANVFFGHMLTKKAPFLDVAFGPGGVLGPDSATPAKSAHGVYVHIQDFFEWSILCKVNNCGDVSMAELMRYLARSGLAETAAATKTQRDLAMIAGNKSEVEKLTKQLNETLRLLGFHADGRELTALLKGETVISHDHGLGIDIPVRLLDWASTTNFQNGTNLWDVYFDFQNLADQSFKDAKKLRQAFGNPEPGFLASSMNVASNPMFMGRPKVVDLLFATLGWH